MQKNERFKGLITGENSGYLKSVFYGMKYVQKVMKAQSYCSIVNTASVGGFRGVVGLTRNSAI